MLSENFKESHGFTFIELLASISILVILLAVSVGLYGAFRPEHNLNEDVRKIESVLRLARSNTLASNNKSSFGVHMESAQVVLFEGILYDPVDTGNKITELDSRNELYSISLAGTSLDVVFNRLDGTTLEYGNISLRVRGDPSKTLMLYIEPSGSISSEQEGLVGSSNLTNDSRHVHFGLGWSIQNATTLEFRFPNTSITKSVTMAPYFSSGTSFDWSGSFDVGGIIQEFRVHTHALDAFDTELSITRSRNNGKNTEQVEVRIIDSGITKSIATYLADVDDTVNVGSYGGIMEIQ